MDEASESDEGPFEQAEEEVLTTDPEPETEMPPTSELYSRRARSRSRSRSRQSHPPVRSKAAPLLFPCWVPPEGSAAANSFVLSKFSFTQSSQLVTSMFRVEHLLHSALLFSKGFRSSSGTSPSGPSSGSSGFPSSTGAAGDNLRCICNDINHLHFPQTNKQMMCSDDSSKLTEE